MYEKSQERRNYSSADSKYFKKIAKKYSNNFKDRLKSP